MPAGVCGAAEEVGGTLPAANKEKRPFSTAPRGQKKGAALKVWKIFHRLKQRHMLFLTGMQPFPAAKVKEVSIGKLLLSVFGNFAAP